MLNNSNAPSRTLIVATSRVIFQDEGKDAVLDYLTEVASYDYKCSDKCDQWAIDTYEEYKEDIEGEYKRK